MSVFYLDSSAWLKRYWEEPGTAAVLRLFAGAELASSVLGYIEVATALSRQQLHRQVRDEDLAQQQRDLHDDWNDLNGIPLTENIVQRALSLAARHRLRGADAVHLATALEVQASLSAAGESVIFVASDRELLSAAEAAGLAIENPAMAL